MHLFLKKRVFRIDRHLTTPMAQLRLLLSLFLLSWIAGCRPQLPDDIASAYDDLPAEIDFNTHIKPILSDRCFACHGPDNNTREAGLRLDVASAALDELPESPGNYAIVPGNLQRSKVMDRLITDNPEEMMPPPASNLTLSAEEKAYLFKWIEQGAEYKEHWSFIPPSLPEIPEVKDPSWAQHPVDAFVASRLEQENMEPSKEAARETLIRRVTFDLTGLPPTLEEIDAFLNDTQPEAYEHVVDRLLDSPAYGERMANSWLDVARYADSHGYQDDGMRNVWPWRDWVIDAFNENMPFDAFIKWQLAGDLLPDPTQEQLLATAFNRHHMQSQEGGIVPEEYRTEYVADRTHTVGTAFLGLTLQCARCHDHKYDPISQKEYYQLFGYFNSVNEFGNIPYAGEASPTIILPSEEAKAELAELAHSIEALEKTTHPFNPQYNEGFNSWIAGSASAITADQKPAKLLAHYPLDKLDGFSFNNSARPDWAAQLSGDRDFPVAVVEGKFGNAIQLNGETWFDAGADRYYFERNEPFSLSIWFKALSDSVAGPLVGKSGGYFNGNRGYMLAINEDGSLHASLNHVFPDNSIELQSRDKIRVDEWQHVAMTYDGSSKASGLQLYMNGSLLEAEIIVDNLQKSIVETFNFYRNELTNWGGAGNLRIGFVDGNQTRLEEVIADDLRVYGKDLTLFEVQFLAGFEAPMTSALKKGPSQWSEQEQAAMRRTYLEQLPSYQKSLAELEQLRGRQNEIMTVQEEVMITRDRKEPRPTYILDRGVYDAPGDQVEPGTPEILPAIAPDQPANRLTLANWLLDENHPLTARVQVNRFWQHYFGQGIVKTPDDFGNQGTLPSHPELLDWLAVTFQQSGWNVKALQRLIVTSNTYKQSSIAPPILREKDPENVLLARGPSYRMSAEMIRDNALAVSGLLNRKIGGPSVHPYQPPGLWKQLATRNETVYNQDSGDKLYRRGMYTVWKRSSPPPSLMSFDAADRDYCVVKRQKTSTPLQSLILLNDPQYVEAARLLAERMQKEGGKTLEEQITFAFRLLTSRHPTDLERSQLANLYQEEFDAFSAEPEEALALLGVGEYPRDENLDAITTAGLTLVTSTIMNFDEAYMKR